MLLALGCSKKALCRLLAIFKDEYKADFAHGPLGPLEGLSKTRHSLVVALRELEVAGEIHAERYLVPLVRYPGMPFIREDQDDLEARVCVAIGDGNRRGLYWANERWSAYQYLKAHNPESCIGIYRDYRGRNKLRFFVEPDARYAAASAPVWPENILRWVAHLRINHLLLDSEYDAGALTETDEETQRLDHTISFSTFARDYLADLFVSSPLSDHARLTYQGPHVECRLPSHASPLGRRVRHFLVIEGSRGGRQALKKGEHEAPVNGRHLE
ncbi:hypothetical protein [Caballeronia sp. SBC2]|uniref:hypothetical protein n=1 Tax=Caballeronia sp. SBC2 TaxID=2705547 RepID=UPI0019D1B222|nr:hypothetical protein [Caballeronia sp. SBC2]